MHTPYDGSNKPFTIGLKPLDLADWIEVDGHLEAYLEEKRRLYHEERDNVLAFEPGSEAAQAEVLDLLVEHLCRTEPQLYHLKGRKVEVLGGKFTVDLDDTNLPALAIAGLLVQEDLVIMGKRAEEWCLVAASLCFPSSWILREKVGKAMHEVHGPVPEFGAGTRNAGLIARMFDNLSPARPVVRWNWSLYGNDRLYHPPLQQGLGPRFGTGDITGKVFLRLEHQTLRKLPQTGDILFTIRIHLDPLEVLKTHPEGPALALAIEEQLLAMTPEQLDYKGLTFERDALSARLQQLALKSPSLAK